MTDTVALLEKLNTLGVSIVLEGNELVFRPGNKLPTDLIPELKTHKPEIVERLRQQAKDNLSRRYQQTFQGEGLINEELAELARRVEVEGVVLVHSGLLDDFIAFHRDDVDPATIPAGFVPYSEHELQELFGPDKPDISPDTLKRIHAAKKTGANITSNQLEE